MREKQTTLRTNYIKFEIGCIRGVPIMYMPKAIKSNNSDISII